MPLEYKDFDFTLKQTTEDDEYFRFEGYGSTFGNIDLGGDRVWRGAFSEDITMMGQPGKNIPALWQHGMKEPVGIYEQMREDERGLFVMGKLPKEDDFVRGRVMPQMKVGSVNKLSIGYRPIEFDYEEMENQRIRNLRKIKLYEVSLVTFPMNEEAEITAMKSITRDEIIAMTERELAKYLRNVVRLSRKSSDLLISYLKKGGLWDTGSTIQRDAEKVIRNYCNDLKTIKF